MRILDGIALGGIIQSYWGIDTAAFAPGLLSGWGLEPGWYWMGMYIQGILAAFYLFARATTSR